jgi:putative membrane-bound dehydrogenase-like protein
MRVWLLLLCTTPAPLLAQVSPEESLKSLRSADGTSVSLWAAEPMVNNPTTIDVDSRGRVWVAEGKNYRMKLRQLDNMGRVEGADQIRILEDTDNDGTADKATVFADNIFPIPLGMAVEEIWKNGTLAITRVYLGNAPDLLVLEDTDGDNMADHRYPLLTGFRGVDSDHGLHGMTLGPDGKLYFTVGDARYGADNIQERVATFDVTDRSGRRVSADNYGTTLRINRDGTHFEVLTSGHRNNYEVTVDSFGNVFGSDNDDDGKRGCRMYWAIDGGRYGYHHPDSTRHWAEELPGIIPKLVGTGNGSPSGIFVYEGHSLPEKYFGAVLQIDAGTRQINFHPLARYGSGFRSSYEVLLKGTDDWFRPIDLAASPDGALYVCDWYDAGVGGNRFSDQTTGRIYRLSGNRPVEAIGATTLAQQPLQALMSPNKTTQIAALGVLIEQRADVREALRQILASGQSFERARALHVLHAFPETGAADTLDALHNENAQVRALALQLLIQDVSEEYLVSREKKEVDLPRAVNVLDRVLPLAADADPGVRRILLLGLRRVPTNLIEDQLTTLALSWDGQDRFYLEAIRSAIVHREPEYIDSLFQSLGRLAESDPRVDAAQTDVAIATPPYYPIDSNDAFPKIGDTSAPATATSKLLGIAWVLQRKESLPAIRSAIAENKSPQLESVAAEAIASIPDIAAADLLLDRLALDSDITLKRPMLQKLADGFSKHWSELRDSTKLKEVLERLWQIPELRLDVIQMIMKGELKEFAPRLRATASDGDAIEGERVAAILALGRLHDDSIAPLASGIVQQAEGKTRGGEVAMAALDALWMVTKTEELTRILMLEKMPSDIRRRALQFLTSNVSGVEQTLQLRATNSFTEELESELRFLLHNHSDSRVRAIAIRELPLGTASAGKIHNYASLMALSGDAQRGRDIFVNSTSALCARCHRIDGGGALVGPDLSTIGTKYGPQEMLYHIQNPSGAINYNYTAQIFLLEDGSALSGLVLKRDGGVITLGLANGTQTQIQEADVEEEKLMTNSIMPEGLLAALTDQQVADLLEFLATLRHASPTGDPSALVTDPVP